MKLGKIIGFKYRILKQIGQGGNSSVFLGENLGLANLWAIKAVDRNNPSAIEAMQEVNMLKCLNHPMLPRIADLCEDDRYTYIIMDYIEGETLADFLKTEGRIPEPRLVEWAKQLCDVLVYLHSQNPPVIYRDLKPSNIILGKGGRLHLVDFGTAKCFKEQALEDTVYIGTQGYAAPEQFGSGKSDERTDLYNLGMTLFHLATGVHPAKISYEEAERHLKQSGISHGFSSFVKDLIRYDPEKRIRNAATCLTLLNRMDKPSRYSGKSGSERYAGRLTLGIMGVVHGVGTTYIGLCLANYFSGRGYKTAFVNYCGNGDIARLEAVLNRSNRLTYSDEGCFIADNITYFKDGSEASGRPGRGFNVILADFGSSCGENTIGEFNRSDIRMVVCPSVDWKLFRVNDFAVHMRAFDPHGEWIYVFPSFERSVKQLNKKALQINHVLIFPYVSNPYNQNRNEQKSIQEVLGKVMLMSGIESGLR